MHVAFSADRVHLFERARYEQGCFPPLVYLGYYAIFKLIFRQENPMYRFSDLESLDYLYFMIVYYSIFVALLLYVGISLWGRDRLKNLLIFVCLMISVPFYVGGVAVANSTLIVMALLLMALKLRESDSPWQREAALVIIAVCAGIKIYPAVFGLLYLLDKRFKEAIRLTIYGIVLFFAPFSIFGGVKGFMYWLENVKVASAHLDFGRIQCIKGVIYSIACLADVTLPSVILRLVPIVFAILMLVLACITKSRYRRVFYLCAIMVFFPTNAFRYTLSYLSIPFIMSFQEQLTGGPSVNISSSHRYAVISYIETAILSLIYAMPVIPGILTRFRSTNNIYTLTYTEMWIYLWAYLLVLVVVIHDTAGLIK